MIEKLHFESGQQTWRLWREPSHMSGMMLIVAPEGWEEFNFEMEGKTKENSMKNTDVKVLIGGGGYIYSLPTHSKLSSAQHTM